MTAKKLGKQESKAKETKEKETRETTFKCRFCGETRPLGEMIIMTRFFPQIVACRDCEKKMQ